MVLGFYVQLDLKVCSFPKNEHQSMCHGFESHHSYMLCNSVVRVIDFQIVGSSPTYACGVVAELVNAQHLGCCFEMD